jgi:RNA polymerase sigma-70 factor (ECF subfamily)
MPPRDADTEELLRRAGDGDRVACGDLLERHRVRLQRMIELRMDRRLAARVDPADVVQDTLAEAYRELPDYLRDRSLPFYPWLGQLAWDRLIELHRRHVRAQRRSVTREERWEPPLPDESAMVLAERLVGRASSPSSRLRREETCARVRSALARLAESDREVLLLRHLEQLSLAEIAAVLGLSEATAGKRHLRALERLRGLLAGPFAENES